MNNLARNLQVLDGGSDVALDNGQFETKAITKATLRQDDKWIDSTELSKICAIPDRTARYALQVQRMSGRLIDVREIASNVGLGGKMLQVHVDSLPADIRESWYLSRGIDVTLKPETGELVAVDPKIDEKVNDSNLQKQYQLAFFKHNLIKPTISILGVRFLIILVKLGCAIIARFRTLTRTKQSLRLNSSPPQR